MIDSMWDFGGTLVTASRDSDSASHHSSLQYLVLLMVAVHVELVGEMIKHLNSLRNIV
jgi:hypothetical protein